MKQKTYTHGKDKFKAYFKEAGYGWEVGLKHGRKQIFVGNFIYKKEATAWYSHMNKEIDLFSKRYWVGPKFSKDWYGKFFSNHLYKSYYSFINKMVSSHHKVKHQALAKDVKKYKQLKKKWTPKEQVPFAKSA